MLKKLFILLFTIFISSNLFAENHDIHKQIADIRVEIEKIRNSTNKIDLKSDIKNLEEKINKIEDDFNQNNIDKKEIEKSFENTIEIVERQDVRLEDLNHYFFWYGIVITILLFGVSYISYRFTSNHARDIVNDWLKKNKNEILEPIKTEANDLQKNIEKQALYIYQEKLKEFKIDDKLDKSQRENKEEILKKVNEILENKEREDYSYDDWMSKFLKVYNDKNISKTILYLDKAKKHASTKYELISVLFYKATVYLKNENQKDNLLKSIQILEEIIDKFADNLKDTSIRMVYLKSIHNLSVHYLKNNKREKELEYINLFLSIYDAEIDLTEKESFSQLFTNKIEYNLINSKINEEDKLLFLKNNKIKKYAMIFDMLIILERAIKQEVDSELISWKEKYIETIVKDFDFEPLFKWSDSFDDLIVNKRLKKYLAEFKTVLKNN